jgi:Tetratricopeptide repeat
MVLTPASAPIRLVLSLDGFEPDRGSLQQFARLIAATGRNSGLAIDEFTRTAETLERIFGCNDWSAALVALGPQVPEDFIELAAFAERSEFDPEAFAGLDSRNALATLLTGLSQRSQVSIELEMSAELSIPFRTWLQIEVVNRGLATFEADTSAKPYPIDDARLSPGARRILALLALAGSSAPVDHLFGLLETPPAVRDSLLDELDGLANIGGSSWIFDLQFLHPGFPTNQVYRLASPGVARALLSRVPEWEQRELASELFEYLIPRMDYGLRASSRLLRGLARISDRGFESIVSERMLSWWACRDQSEELARFLADRSAETFERRLMRAVLDRTAAVWPVYRTRVLLEAYATQQANSDSSERGTIHLWRARLLRRERDLVKAYEEANKAAELLAAANQIADMANAHALAARSATESANPDIARRHWEMVLDALDCQPGGTEGAVAARRNLADLAAARGELAMAINYQAAALEGARSLDGATATQQRIEILRVLALFERRNGDLRNAERHLEEALDAERRIYGNDLERLSDTLKILADTRHEAGNSQGATRAQREALELDQQRLGPLHPRVLASWKLLASWAQGRGDLLLARECLEAALSIAEALQGPGKGEAALLFQAVAALTDSLSDPLARNLPAEGAGI